MQVKPAAWGCALSATFMSVVVFVRVVIAHECVKSTAHRRLVWYRVACIPFAHRVRFVAKLLEMICYGGFVEPSVSGDHP